jgi:hypothetical protein
LEDLGGDEGWQDSTPNTQDISSDSSGVPSSESDNDRFINALEVPILENGGELEVGDFELDSQDTSSNSSRVPAFEGTYGPYYPTYTAAAFSIFLSVSGISRANFDTLLQILKHSEFRVADLPSSYKACKRLQAGLPTLPTYNQDLPIDKEHSHITEDISSPAYHHSISDIVHRILSTPSLRKDLYFGPGIKVDNPSEFWHGTLWRESSLFGADFVRCPNGKSL